MKTILVIDDFRELNQDICEILELEGYATCNAGNGVDGLRAIETYHPDLILCNINMPNMDGYELVQHLREDPQYAPFASTPLIFVTARTTTTDIQYGMDTGADAYITKPFNPDDMLKTIATFLA